MPTDGILSNGVEWLLIRYDPQAKRLIKSRRLRLSLDPATTTAKVLEIEVSHSSSNFHTWNIQDSAIWNAFLKY